MFNIILYEPEIPPNSGNIIRLCANSGARLHFIEPLGFTLDDRQLRRAGLDYHEFAELRVHASLEACLASLGAVNLFAFTTKAATSLSDIRFPADSALLFGPESRGLPATVLATVPPARRVRIPMVAGSRSLNLSNAVSIALFEAWRQHAYAGNAGVEGEFE
ncbi:MAG: tRNA (cytidine(34)-2'-O)-methyltransferase [Gammaproteobacteria bacterium]|nr:tRNA (cytidine(34)-2'-O)-methyltransferase [Gammaproteobacteria bacterium]